MTGTALEVAATLHWNRLRIHMLRQLPAGSIGAEIGVFRGGFSALILDVVRPTLLHLVDPWQHRPDRAETIYGGIEPHVQSQADMDAMFDAVVARFGHAPVRIHRQSSATAARTLDDESLDWVYIDGDHRYRGVLGDLTAYAPKVKPGGWLMGGAWNWDSDPEVRWPVRAAVEAFRRQPLIERFQLATAGDSTGRPALVEILPAQESPVPVSNVGVSPPQYILTKR